MNVEQAIETLRGAASHGVSEGFYGPSEVDEAHRVLADALAEQNQLRAALDEAFIVFVDTQWARAYAHLSPGREDESVTPAKEKQG